MPSIPDSGGAQPSKEDATVARSGWMAQQDTGIGPQKLSFVILLFTFPAKECQSEN